MPTALVPPAPVLPGDATLEVFVYPDNREPDPENKFSDTRRLEYLGEMMANAVYIDVMRQRWVTASGEELKKFLEKKLDDLMEEAGTTYEWNKRVYGYPDDFDANSPEESRTLFCTYAGAVSVQYGFETLEKWIKDLLSVL
ncbi:hypothetical protein C8Q73DRAFT_445332 [Cubamyces lactineus]|nr:hypothetical protein C8Q73DRAFT_445332 [Cubamyces lactineus]